MSMQLSISKPLIDRVVPRSLVADIALIMAGALLTAVSAQIAIPMWPVPITGQTFAVLLVGSVLGASRGAISMIAYFSMGAAGLPVFSGAASGLTFGPTFGYLVGFIAAAGVIGWLSQLSWQKKAVGVAASFLVGNAVIYLFGLSWLTFALGNLGYANDLVSVFSAGLVPFLIGDAIKMTLAALALPMAWKYLGTK
ncbi:MAG: biotin transporter BioY [Actinomycetota bacterium]